MHEEPTTGMKILTKKKKNRLWSVNCEFRVESIVPFQFQMLGGPSLICRFIIRRFVIWCSSDGLCSSCCSVVIAEAHTTTTTTNKC